MKSFFKDYTLKELKEVAKKYKEVVQFNYSKLNKDDLAKGLDKHLIHDEKGIIRLKDKIAGKLEDFSKIKKLEKEKMKIIKETKKTKRREYLTN